MTPGKIMKLDLIETVHLFFFFIITFKNPGKMIFFYKNPLDKHFYYKNALDVITTKNALKLIFTLKMHCKWLLL